MGFIATSLSQLFVSTQTSASGTYRLPASTRVSIGDTLECGLAGYTEEETKKMGDLSKFSKEEMDGMIDAKWQEKRTGLMNGQTQKVVGRAEVRGYVEEGWEFVTWLDEERSEAVVRLPK